MKLFDRYFGTEFLKVFLFSLFGFVMLFLIRKIIDDAMKIESTEAPYHLYLYIIYSIPEIISWVIPASLLFAVCYIVAQFTISRELVAIQAAGVSFYRAVWPVFATGLAMTFILFLFQNFLVTVSNKAADEELSYLKQHIGVKQSIIWQKNLRGKEGYYFIYYLSKKELKILGGFNYLKIDKEQNPIAMYEAKRAKYNKKKKNWTLYQVRQIIFNPDLSINSIQKSDALTIRFPDKLSFFINPSKDPRDLNLFELFSEIKRRKEQSYPAVAYIVQAHTAFSFPIMCIIVAVVGAVVGSMGSLRSSGPLVRSILISVSTMLLYTIVFNIGKNLGTSEVLPAYVAGWGPTVLFVSLTGILLYYNKK